MNTIIDKIDLWSTAQTLKTSNRGLSASNQSLLGIKKLRELILELAVRGKLVPQVPNDQPASELLKQIAKEKSQLIKEGKIKKQDVLPEIGEDEKPFELPVGWEWSLFNNITHLITDGTHYTPTYISDGVPFLSVKDMSSGVLDFSDCRYISQEQHDEFAKRCNPQKGDLLLTKVGTTGIPILIETDKQFSIFVSVALIKFPHSLISGRFLSLLIKSPLVKTQSEEGTEGIGNKNLVLRKIVAFKIVIPPLAEQHRIVAKVDELMALCDQLEQQQTDSNAAHQILVETLLGTLTQAESPAAFDEAWQRIATHIDTLFTTEHSIDQLKQTILQLAVMGKLTQVFRESHPELVSGPHSASELLKQIAKEKARLVKEGKIKKQTPLPEITDDEKPFELPEGWEWVKLGYTSILKGGFAYQSSKFIDDGVCQVIRMGNIRPDYLRLDENPVYISELLGDVTSEYQIEPDDILLTMTGTKGKRDYLYSLIITDEHLLDRKLFLNQRLCIVRTFIFPKFQSLVLKNDLFLDLIYAKSTGTANQANIGMTAINEWIIPLPPLAEQHRIVSKVDELFALCDALKDRLREAQTLQAQLAGAVVEGALNTPKGKHYQLKEDLNLAAEPGL